MAKKWLKAAGVRALKTVCQTAIATIGTTALLSEVHWLTVISASLLAGVLSILTSLAGLPEVEGSLLTEAEGTGTDVISTKEGKTDGKKE